MGATDRDWWGEGEGRLQSVSPSLSWVVSPSGTASFPCLQTWPSFCGSNFYQSTFTWCSGPNRHFGLLRSVNTPSSCVPLALRQ